MKNKSELRLCWYHGNLMVFHTWGYGKPWSYSKIEINSSKSEKCTVAILEDEKGEIVNALPEDIRFLDCIFDSLNELEELEKNGEN